MKYALFGMKYQEPCDVRIHTAPGLVPISQIYIHCAPAWWEGFVGRMQKQRNKNVPLFFV